jgi:membrane protease YdiL (CAAX protease family)
MRLLLVALALELARIIAFPLVRLVMPLWILMPMLLAAALAALPLVAGLGIATLGFRPWREWSREERSYFAQIMCAAALVATLLALIRIESGGAAALRSDLLTVLLPYAFFGFYQEVVYRGAIQSAMTGRLGVPAGIVTANVLFTFGPLHWIYLQSPEGIAVSMLVAIFAMGLFFGTLYHRSGNLWLPACFHGAGNALMVWQFTAPAA